MIFRNINGDLVDIRKNAFKNDKTYYHHIMKTQFGLNNHNDDKEKTNGNAVSQMDSIVKSISQLLQNKK